MDEITITIPRHEALALIDRADLLASECEIRADQRVNWLGRQRALAGRTSGGSTLDRQNLVNAMTTIEDAVRGRTG